MRPEDPNFSQDLPPVPPPPDSGQSEPEPGDIEAGQDLRPGEPGPEAMEFRDAGPQDAGPQDAGPEKGDRPNLSPPSPPMRHRRPPGSNGRAYAPEPQSWPERDQQNSADLSATPPAQAKPVSPSRRPPPQSASARPPRSIAPAEEVWTDAEIPYQPKSLGVVDQLLLLLAAVATRWKKVLRWVRSQLPPDLQRQLSDGLLTAIALGLLVLLLALGNPLGAGGSEQAESLPGITAAAPDPQDLFAEPIAGPEPTPEQSLIADIQAQVSRLSRSYGAGLVQSVEVNLPENTLGVNVAEAWYGLLTNQQNEVAQDIYAQAQGLKFATLQLRDPEGVVVARNPVVGPNMIVLRRLP